MVGAVVDNHVFDIMVARFMPVLGDHIKQHDIQLSVACLPWFLTLFVNSLPLPYALRIMDCFFLEGAKVLFQIGLAILKVNGDAIMKVTDDGELMKVLKGYFASLGDVETEISNGISKPTTKFNQLIVTAYREFQNVSNDMIIEIRKTQSLATIQNLDLYSKRSAIRNLKTTGKFTKEEMLHICDQFYSVQFYSSASKMCDRLSLNNFSDLLGNLASWADMKPSEEDLASESPIKPIIGTIFIANLFNRVFDLNHDGFVDLQDVVKGLGRLVHTDVIGVLGTVFAAHDGDQDGFLNRDETIHLSETFLFLQRKIDNEKKLGSISSFLNRAFMMNLTAESENANVEFRLSLELFKELISADDYLLGYFNDVFPTTFVLIDSNTGVQQTTYAPPMKEISGK
jgi:TBC1 domain family member 8/9